MPLLLPACDVPCVAIGSHCTLFMACLEAQVGSTMRPLGVSPAGANPVGTADTAHTASIVAAARGTTIALAHMTIAAVARG